MLSGPVILLKITLEKSINSQNFCSRVRDTVLMNNSPSNIFDILLLLEKYHQDSQMVLAAYRHEWVKDFREKMQVD